METWLFNAYIYIFNECNLGLRHANELVQSNECELCCNSLGHALSSLQIHGFNFYCGNLSK